MNIEESLYKLTTDWKKKHFSKINEILKDLGKEEIIWG